LTQLRRLTVTGAGITDAGLSWLEGLRNLQELDLCGTNVTDAGLEHLCKLQSLSLLWVRRGQLSDGGIFALRLALPNLRVLEHGGDS
jgi:hypothetical protein